MFGKHKNAEELKWQGYTWGPRTRGPRQGWLPGSLCPIDTLAARESTTQKTPMGANRTGPQKACYLKPKMMKGAVATCHSRPVKHSRKTNPHIQWRHHTRGRTQPTPPAHTGVPSEPSVSQHCHPSSSRGMTTPRGTGALHPTSLPSFSSSMQPLPKWLSTKARWKPELEPQTSIRGAPLPLLEAPPEMTC